MDSLKKQSGMSLYLIMFLFVIAACSALLAMKVIPHYMEYKSIKRAILGAANSEAGKSGTVSEIRKAFERNVSIDNIKAISNTDLEIAKDGNETVVSAAWSARVPLIANWTLLIDFAVASNEKD
jgi:hypothetical protein